MKEFTAGSISVLLNGNKYCGSGPDFLTAEQTKNTLRIHSTLPDYMPTHLVKLGALAENMGIKGFYVKDESKRFGLNAFKGLGGLYALTMVVCQKLGLDADKVTFADLKKEEYKAQIQDMVFVTATDGNHGKGVAWAAGQLGCKAYVYMPKGSAEIRAQAIRDAGRAEAFITDMNYDDTVRYAAKMAEENGWQLVQDTSWDGYEQIPAWIVQGYTTMAEEAARQLEKDSVKPTHVFVQAGVGAMAGGIVGYLAHRYENSRPYFVIVEPENIPCIYYSAKVADGSAHPAEVQKDTIMAGLNCGEPCQLTWPILRDFTDWYMKCPDSISAHGMRILANPLGADTKIISGESGAVTAGVAEVICSRKEYAQLKKQMYIDENSVILCFSTEGDTDPEQYDRIVNRGEYPF